jgi:uncharacterized protein YbaA (DUF1428 family)
MIHKCIAMTSILALNAVSTLNSVEPSKDSRCYELRVYTAAEGKLDALHARFRDHTCKLFEKHGMTNVGYWVPLENSEHKLYYILAYPSRDAREKSWSEFMNDPDWKAAFAASEKDGKLVTHVDSTFLHATDFSPEIKPSVETQPRVFELRIYTATPNNLPALHARFRDHTIALFRKHGMTNFGYWAVDANQPDADKKRPGDTLIYMLAHKSKDARDASFKTFQADPDWIAAKNASEKAAGGSLTVANGVKSILLVPTDYSPTK